MKRIMTSVAAALAAAGYFGEPRSPARGINYRTGSDPERVKAAEEKRARKNAKRLQAKQ